MTPSSTIRAAALGALLSTLLAACAGNQVVPREVPPPPVTSVAQADQQLAGVARERAVIEARFADREQVCYNKFFATNCLNEAKEQRRAALSVQRAIEIQAQRFKRTTVVEERDRQVAEAERRFAEQEAKMAAEPPKPAPAVKPEPAARTSTVPARVAQQKARVKAEQQREEQDAGKRAGSVQAYEERKAEAERRQKAVAERKAKRAAKEAKDQAKAQSQPKPAQ